MKIPTVVHSALIGTSCFLSVWLLSTTTKAQTAVDLELALLLDGSGSISSSDFQLQLDAYRNVFANPSFFDDLVADFIPDGGLGQIAVSAWQFSSSITQEIDWTLIDNQTAATNFGNQFLTITQESGSTNIGGAINDATSSALSNDFNGNRIVLDLSTDGQPTIGPDATTASLNAIASGIDAINAIGVGSGISEDFLSNNIVRGEDSFLLVADSFAEFEQSLTIKLEREIEGNIDSNKIPEPNATISLLALSALGATFLWQQHSGDC